MSTYDGHLTALADAADRFDAALRTGDRTAPVPSCPGWTVVDLGEHLTDVHRWALGQLTGEEQEPLAHADLADRFRAGADELIGALRTRTADTACMAIYPPDTAATWARRQAHETAIHLWDAQRALGGDPRLQAELATDGVREVVDDLYPRQVRLGRVEPLTEPVVFAFTDAPGEAVLCGGEPAVRVTGRAGDLLLVLWGRRTPEMVHLTVEGDRGALDRALGTKLVP
ncbi:maleylpyruvate isomerase family mycothiol-dependent enzyme [Curtobacterium pusillum]|uniref:maleylpyruvate isomerase family mycothiol-dependent enzyme n=1 Tax=Curtobacterium pusillum TaxID=69373 RepID=UPI0011A2726D|nr:maleylpyruvate isomerase family mycothiol-dependent enzyme [Curtobacterium pusillum]